MDPGRTQQAARAGYRAASGLPARTASATRQVGQRAHAQTFARSTRFHGARGFVDPTADKQGLPAFDPAGVGRTSPQIRTYAREFQPVVSAGSGPPHAE